MHNYSTQSINPLYSSNTFRLIATFRELHIDYGVKPLKHKNVMSVLILKIEFEDVSLH